MPSKHSRSQKLWQFVQKLLVESGCRISQRRDDFCALLWRLVSHGGALTIAAKEGPGAHRPARRQSGADAAPNASYEPGKPGCRPWPHLPAGAEIRERRQPHRGQPVAANLPNPAGASRVLLRGRSERISATRLQWKYVIDGPD